MVAPAMTRTDRGSKGIADSEKIKKPDYRHKKERKEIQ